jgi:hypothetical protein
MLPALEHGLRPQKGSMIRGNKTERYVVPNAGVPINDTPTAAYNPSSINISAISKHEMKRRDRSGYIRHMPTLICKLPRNRVASNLQR